MLSVDYAGARRRDSITWPFLSVAQARLDSRDEFIGQTLAVYAADALRGEK